MKNLLYYMRYSINSLKQKNLLGFAIVSISLNICFFVLFALKIFSILTFNWWIVFLPILLDFVWSCINFNKYFAFHRFIKEELFKIAE